MFYTGVLDFARRGRERDRHVILRDGARRPAADDGDAVRAAAGAGDDGGASHSPGKPPAARAAAMARSAVGGLAEAASHCEVAGLLGARMGLPERVQVALRHLYERWDGKGLPGDLRGEQIRRPRGRCRWLRMPTSPGSAAAWR